MEALGRIPDRTSSIRERGSKGARGERTIKILSSVSNATPRTSPRPSLPHRNSAPLTSARIAEQPPLEGDLRAYIHRGSVSSIKDDPFFRNYQSPTSVSLARELRSATYSNADPPPSALDLSIETSGNSNSQIRGGMADINIAVIGSAGVGKSTLIQRALGLRAAPTSIASSQRMTVDGVAYTVSMIELDLESFDIKAEKRIQWPKQMNGYIVPRMDGVLLLYDVMNRESIVKFPQALNGLAHSYLPTMLVSCKCDNPENTRQIDVENMEAACSSCVEAVKTAENVPESARLCLSSMLRAVMANRTGPSSVSSQNLHLPEIQGPRRRATSTFEATDSSSRPLSQNSKHSRASSEHSLIRGFTSPTHNSSRGPQPVFRTHLNQQITLPSPHEAPPLSSHPAFRNDSSQNIELTSKATKPRSPVVSHGAGGLIDNSFLDMEESDQDSSHRCSDDIPILQRENNYFEKPAKVVGVTFDELVDRLLDQNMSRADNNFSDIFLCLYRKFAAPSELFSAIINRLERIADDKNIHYLTRTSTQLRIITVVAKWVANYPGDFAYPATSAKLEAFIGQLFNDPVFAAAAQEMRQHLRSRVHEDDDTGWARTDADVENEANNLDAPPSPASVPTRVRTHTKSDFEDEIGDFHIDDDGSEEMMRKESRGDSYTSGRPLSSSQSLSSSFHTVEDYEREAATMLPKGTLPLTKFRYHIFMDTSDDDFADEMTRIDWVMFSSIRLRDLVRHVSLPLEQKEKMTNVHRLINHFNHIAKWVANMILMRDKAKHRALMLEKFMTIALKLRQLNNYNGLAAVLAGINGSAIHRLTQTRNLVPADVQKRFAQLVILMGTQKSHSTYRLAWENSSLPRIPFIPLHRRDLVSAEQGSRTFVGSNNERINWKKFEILAEVILPIMKSHVVPYPNLSKHESSRELILDCKMNVDDEESYQRSLQLESSSGTSDVGKKKFPWFQKEK
ncbi:related to aimless RasGEF (aleA) [Rhynchosporium graminicola]|uniref:Related to aimless RasGEF (AleA) n=1 Tax=Rhynchosporium graminicola TaxID=2792576 RepID=A0A1E1LDZ4_9HELO|nr:related to aimless RasGEF (aleA) [Rhynchosporium commune]